MGRCRVFLVCSFQHQHSVPFQHCHLPRQHRCLRRSQAEAHPLPGQSLCKKSADTRQFLTLKDIPVGAGLSSSASCSASVFALPFTMFAMFVAKKYFSLSYATKVSEGPAQTADDPPPSWHDRGDGRKPSPSSLSSRHSRALLAVKPPF